MEQTKKRLSRRNLFTFSLGTIGRDMGVGLHNYLLTFILFTKTLTPIQFSVISGVMIAARLFDAFNDPIMGGIVENTRTRWGKFKPWILIGALSSAAVIFLTFSNRLQGWSFVVSVAVLYFAYSITFTMNDIAYWGMIPSLTSHPDDRNSLTSLTSLCAGAGQGLIGFLLPTFTAGALVIGGNAPTAYTVMAAITCGALLLTQSITLFGVQEEKLPARDTREKLSLKKIVTVISKNDQLVTAGVMLLCQTIANSVLITITTTYIYFDFGYNGILMTFFSLLGGAIGAVVMVFFTPLSKKYSRMQLLTFSFTLSVAGFLSVLAFGILMPSDPWVLKFALMAVGNAFAFLGLNMTYLISMICISNSIEYNQWKFGRREEGIIASVRPFITKLGAAIAQGVVTVVYLIIGVTAYTNQISDVENQASLGEVEAEEKAILIERIIEAVPEARTQALLVCMTLIPLALLTAAYFVFRTKYKISEDRYNEMVREISEREQEAAAPVPAEEPAGEPV